VPFAAHAGLPPSSTLTVPTLLCLMGRQLSGIVHTCTHLSIAVLPMEIRRGTVSIPVRVLSSISQSPIPAILVARGGLQCQPKFSTSWTPPRTLLLERWRCRGERMGYWALIDVKF
jgi:hypothetical protein